MKIEKTKTIPFGDSHIDVDELPKNIRDEIDLFDKISQDYSEEMYRVQVLSIARQALNVQILNDIKEYLSNKTTGDETDDSNEEQ